MSAIDVAALTEEVADVEAVPGGPVVVALAGGRRRLLPPSLAADLEHLRVPGRRRGSREEDGGASDDHSGRERDAGAHCPANAAETASRSSCRFSIDGMRRRMAPQDAAIRLARSDQRGLCAGGFM